MVLILKGQSAWLYPSVFPSILMDFEDGLSVSSVKAAINTGALSYDELFVIALLFLTPWLRNFAKKADIIRQ